MSVFGNYSQYYDLLYRDKDYVGEVKFIDQLIQTYAPQSRRVLELGCGTGHHAVLLAKAGYELHGVDRSPTMLTKANARLADWATDRAAQLTFSQGDVRSVRLNQSFDVVLSLFHVISYQTTNEDLLAAFATAKAHLKPGGILIFDIWYGPAVLSDRPVLRVKRMEDDAIAVTRIAEPVMHPNQNWVDVNYQVLIRDKADQSVEELQETHRLRYLFQPEIELLLHQFALKILVAQAWMSDQPIGFNTWQVCFVVQG
jgi:SAM-dependent methyltransferase